MSKPSDDQDNIFAIEMRTLGTYLIKIVKDPQDAYAISCIEVILHNWANKMRAGLVHRKEAVDAVLKAGFVEVMSTHVKAHGTDGILSESLNNIFDAIQFFYPKLPPKSKLGMTKWGSREDRAQQKHISDVLEAAYVKFQQFDLDRNGCIEGREIESVVEWLWRTCHINDVKLSRQKQIELKRKFLKIVDTNHDGRINFVEFERLFRRFVDRVSKEGQKRSSSKIYPASSNTKQRPSADGITSPSRGTRDDAHEQHLEYLLREARKMFDSIDHDKDGCIDGSELIDIVKWLWRIFHVNGEKLTEARQARMVRKLLQAVDADEDESISFPEFEKFFLEIARRSQSFNTSSPSPRKEEKKKISRTRANFKSRMRDRHVDRLMRIAKHHFTEFDLDHNGLLEGDELKELIQWLWHAYHVRGEKMSEKQQRELVRKTLDEVDKNHDGRISFEEFRKLFMTYASKIATFQRKLVPEERRRLGTSMPVSRLRTAAKASSRRRGRQRT